MIHVCFGLHDKTGRYSKFTGTAILSIFENTTSDVTAHILHDNTLSPDNRDKFIYLAGRYGQTVKFYNVEQLCADKINEIQKILPESFNRRFSVAAIYRLLIAKIFSINIKKIIYLDSDIVVNLDIVELWRIDLGDKILAAIPHVKADYVSYLIDKTKKSKNYLMTSGVVDYDDYFNSGVLLMNLKILRTENDHIMSGIKFMSENPQLNQFDQDLLNYLYANNYIKLPIKFNRLIRDARLEKAPQIQRNIYHFAGAVFGMEMRDPFNRLWMDYFIKTPWFDAQTIGNLYDGFRQMNVMLKQSMINISALMSGKTRAFFIMPQNAEVLKKIFSIRDDEEIILAENNESLKKLFDTMNASRGKKVFFIMVPNFPFGILAQAGFVYGSDFVDGKEFLSEAHGVPLNSYSLIQAM